MDRAVRIFDGNTDRRPLGMATARTFFTNSRFGEETRTALLGRQLPDANCLPQQSSTRPNAELANFWNLTFGTLEVTCRRNSEGIEGAQNVALGGQID